jgi:hypothetical protein
MAVELSDLWSDYAEPDDDEYAELFEPVERARPIDPMLDPDRGLKVRRSDLRRKPLKRRAFVRPVVTTLTAPGVHTTSIPRRHLAEVPRPRRGRAMSLVVVCGIALFAMLIGTVAFQTQIAQKQLALDKVNKQVAAARDRYDTLRRQRAELRSPNRLAVEATRLMMGTGGSNEFMQITPEERAVVLAAAGQLPDDIGGSGQTSLEEFGQVKAVTGDAP